MEVPETFDRDRMARLVRNGRHRDAVGALWDTIGPLTVDYLQADGLTDTSSSPNPLINPDPDSTRVDLDADYRTHSLRLGFGYQF